MPVEHDDCEDKELYHDRGDSETEAYYKLQDEKIMKMMKET